MDGSTRWRVALTYDVEFPDRPYWRSTGVLLDALEAADVRATMFVQGRWAEAEPVLARRIATDGHLVGNHSHHHARMTILTGAGITRDVRAAEVAIEAATGTSPRPWFRCPFGAGSQTLRVLERLAALQYVEVSWHVNSKDWAGASAGVLRRRVVSGAIGHGDGAVVVMHGWPAATAEAAPGIVADLRAAGAEFVRLDALDDVPGRRV
jgi:peptidoglycan/xylan/chitin deacetylase (PgdA/CDA1 family)